VFVCAGGGRGGGEREFNADISVRVIACILCVCVYVGVMQNVYVGGLYKCACVYVV